MLATLAAILACATAQAGLIGSTVDIVAQNGLRGAPCKIGSVNGKPVNAAVELKANGWSGRCSGAYSVDVTDTQILLKVLEPGNYQYALLDLVFGGGDEIAGVSFGGYSNFFDSSFPANGSNLLPTITFDSTAIHIAWRDVNQFNFNPDGTAAFNIMTRPGAAAAAAAAVPEPAGMALFGLALAGLFAARRRAA